MKILIYILFIIPGIFLFAQRQFDVSGAKDHPLISRYPGSDIAWYEEKQYDKYLLAAGPQTSYKQIKEMKTIEGKITRIYYVYKGNATITEIYRNYLTAIEKADFNILANGIEAGRNASQKVGGFTFLRTFYEKNPFPTNKNILITSGSATSGGSCYIAAEFRKPGGNVYIALGGLQYSSEQKIFLLDIIEQTKMEDDLIKINADEMLKGLKANGKFIIYGIYFDFDKEYIKPESEPTLKEIANLLKKDSKLNLFVVGHTDMEGKLEYNIDLSKRRADSVVKELISNYDISPARLSSEGVGPLTPVATNMNEDGRKQNRRVELVMKL